MALNAEPALTAMLSDPASYPHRPDRVIHVQTHISHVFLAGAFVYKLKKPVRFAFLDFRTAEQRRVLCEEEVRLNRRLAGDVYLGVVPVTAAAGGRLRLGGDGNAIDHVVWMRRLPADRMLDRLVHDGTATPAMMREVARRLATFHASAPSGPDVAAFAAPDALRAAWEATIRDAARFAGQLLPHEDHVVLESFGPWFVMRHEATLRARQTGGHVREGHGDLHAEHLCFVDRSVPAPQLPPLDPGLYVFDCIEFSRAFRCIDVASEIAFLAMDLQALCREDLADELVDAYVDLTHDPALRALLPFYCAHRAAIRGLVEGLASAAPEVDAAERDAATERARRHFTLAVRHAWQAGGPAVIAVCGLSGTGKSAVAAALAASTGFAHLASDVLRKRSLGIDAETAAPGAAYAPAARSAVYEALCGAAADAIRAGRGVIADATFLRRDDRERLMATAQRCGVPVLFVECDTSPDVVRDRLAVRRGGPSDADWSVHEAQRASREDFASAEPHLVLDTSGERDAVRAAATAMLWRWRIGLSA